SAATAEPARHNTKSMSPVILCQCMCVSYTSIQSNGIEEVLDSSGAVHERVHMNAHPIEQREMKVGQRRSLLIFNMSPTLQAGSCAACDQDRKVVMIVQTGITHAAAVHVHRVIEERAVAIRSGLHSLEKV